MEALVLTGPKHAGKSSLGLALEKLLHVPFTDLDELITRRTGKSPRELYREGPQVFRTAEAEALWSLLEESAPIRLVIAAGGGIIDNAAAMALLKDTPGIRLAYIQVSAETAWKRIKAAGELPPFLAAENPEETHRTLHRRRADAYRETADSIIDGERGTPYELALSLAKEPILMFSSV